MVRRDIWVSMMKFSLMAMASVAFCVMTLTARAGEIPEAVTAGVAAYNRDDYAAAYRLFAPEAAAGNSDAEVNLGYLYARGQEVPTNQAEALRLYRLSAAQGNGEGMNAIGYKYQFGTGITANIEMAVHWYCLAVERGNPRAMNNLAILHERGEGVPRDIEEARDLWLQASAQGHANAMINLARSYLNSADGPVEPQQATRWMRQAAALGLADAENAMRQAGDQEAFPLPVDHSADMVIQPANARSGRARYCSNVVS